MYLNNIKTPFLGSLADLHNMVMFYGIFLFLTVFCLLMDIMYTYQNNVGRRVSKARRNVYLEAFFVFFPLLIVILIIGPSYTLLFSMAEIHKCQVSIKATAHQ